MTFQDRRPDDNEAPATMDMYSSSAFLPKIEQCYDLEHSTLTLYSHKYLKVKHDALNKIDKLPWRASHTLVGSCDFSTSALMARQASSISTSPVKNRSTSPGSSHYHNNEFTDTSVREGRGGGCTGDGSEPHHKKRQITCIERSSSDQHVPTRLVLHPGSTTIDDDCEYRRCYG